ncbi:MAG: alpha-galactosidase [Planctomycetaceae bacterium]|nr:alpha-galactosidase [Planctomycetaceae bacterium]MCL2305774.1 alpha-galactosidase [Planctomycetaceae bacterium]
MIQKSITLIIALLLLPSLVFAQERFTLETKDNALILSKNDNGRVYYSYYGLKTNVPEKPTLLREAYPCSGGDFVREPALRVVHADGNTSTLLVYQSHEIQKIDDNITELRIRMKDEYYPFHVTLIFKAYFRENLIAARTELVNREEKPVVVYDYASQSMPIRANSYYMTQFQGRFFAEAEMTEEKLTPGLKVLDSKLGIRAHEIRSPFFLLAPNRPAEENQGEVYGATLAWSGSFKFAFEVGGNREVWNDLGITMGVNPFAAHFALEPDKPFRTPEMLTVYSAEGTGKMSRDYHAWGRKYGLREGDKTRSILLNNWEATYFNFNHEKLVKLFQGAKDAGFELFLLDDGWFGNKYPRDNDKAGLGDWDYNQKKLPRGVAGLCEEAERIGISFGIWVEPEMVNPKSELFENHPDWAIHQPHRSLNLQRNQLILDLTNPEVKEYVYKITADLLRENPSISFIKWDANRFITNGGSSYLPPERQSELVWLYHEALYDILERTAKEFPHIRMMLCSGGPGRIDYKALSYFHEFWPSDNTFPMKRIFMQWGFSHFFPAITQAAHVTTRGDTGIKFAFDVAMSCRLGMDIDLEKTSKEDFEFIKSAIAEYKRIRDVVQLGELYRLISPYNSPRCALMYVNADKSRAILFVYQMENDANGNKLIALQGLNPDVEYRLREINTAKPVLQERQRKGSDLMRGQMAFPLQQQGTSMVVELTAPH